MNKGLAIRMAALKISECHTCRQTIKPGDIIILHGRGYAYNRGNASHDGCLWDDGKGLTPFLTWEKIQALKHAVVGSRMKQTSLSVDRILGAVDYKLRHRSEAMHKEDLDVAIALGPDLLAGYHEVLRLLDNDGPWWCPVQSNGRTKWEAPSRPAPTVTVTAAKVPMGTSGPPVEIRYQVDGFRITPVEFKGIIPGGRYAEVRNVGTQTWRHELAIKIKRTEAEAKADVDGFKARCGRQYPAGGEAKSTQRTSDQFLGRPLQGSP